MKWVLILLLGLMVIPALAQVTSINQTEYQKLETSISELQIKLDQLNSSINMLQMEQQKLNSSINDLHTEHKQFDLLTPFYAILPFVGGVIIALIIAIKHSNEIKKQNELIDDTRSVYAEAYVSWVHLVTFNFDDVIRWYNVEYLDKPISERRENFRRNLITHYDHDLLLIRPKVETMELVKVFGKKIADKIWSSTGHMQAQMWQPYDDNGMKLMMDDYKKLVKKAIELKDTLLPYCDENIKKKDHEQKQIYEKIIATT